MSSSAPGGSLGRVFGLHGKGSLGSKEGDDEDGDEEEEAMMAASFDGELENLETLELDTRA